MLGGVLIASSKEHSFDGLIGEQVSLQLEKYLKDKFKKIRNNSCQRYCLFGIGGYIKIATWKSI